jgi:hypothetical protein
MTMCWILPLLISNRWIATDEQDEGGKVDAEDGPVDLVLLGMEEVIGEDDAWISGPDEDIGLEKTGISCEP